MSVWWGSEVPFEYICWCRPLRGFDLVKDRDTGNSKGYGFCIYQVYIHCSLHIWVLWILSCNPKLWDIYNVQFFVVKYSLKLCGHVNWLLWPDIEWNLLQDPSVMDIACAALNGLKMGDRTLTVRRASARWEWHSDRTFHYYQGFLFTWETIACLCWNYLLCPLCTGLFSLCSLMVLSFVLLICHEVGLFWTLTSMGLS